MKSPALSALRKTTVSALIAATLWAGPLLYASAFDDLMAGLRQALAAPAGNSAPNPQVTQYLNALGDAMAKGKYADAEQALNALRSGYSSGNPTIETLLDKMLVEIQAATVAANRELDRALDEILNDAATKAVAGACRRESLGRTTRPSRNSSWSKPLSCALRITCSKRPQTTPTKQWRR